MKTIYLLLGGLLCLSGALSVAHGKDYGEGVQNFTDSKILNNKDGSHDHWQGIGRLYTMNGRCTAALLDTQDVTGSPPTPAYVLTAGHCTELTNANIVTNKPIQGFMQFNYFADTAPYLTYPLKKIAWRSVQGVDIAVIELDVSLQTLLKEGIRPLGLATERPVDGTDVLIVGAPVHEQDTLRLAACTLQPAQEIVEGRWVWRNTLMTRCKDIKGGGSGSPLLDRHTNQIIGVIGTGNLTAQAYPCEQHAPCTPDGGHYKAILGNIYGNATNYLSGCFVQGRLVQGATSFCPLYPVFSVSAPADSPQRYRRAGKKANGSADIPNWNYKFSIDTPFYRHKTVQTAKDCQQGPGYSQTISAKNAFINTAIGDQPGLYFLCILGVGSADQRPEEGLTNNALSLPVEILENAPTAQPELMFTTGVQVSTTKNEQPHRTYAYKFGPTGETDCSDKSDYDTSEDIYAWLENSHLPGKLCTIAYDISKQASEPRMDILNPTPLRDVQHSP
ncbi:serine protease [Pseudomonas sp. FP198]|uniref:trypsin-like serine peptidase n=1 Tax=Pseudomonas sp. FP198 TaxID=2954084 RepID=UPI0027339626|nr:trypsin-like peptidase domain-containing protein [Pseudomonas sp. FP198]WLG95509.1 trypsin-like peptidase domain-containing protein [Pseudomonas sp. FP198]